MHHDILCHDCRQQEATYLIYWTKYYRDIGRTAYTDPSLICNSCKEKFTGSLQYFERCPNLISFTELWTMPDIEIGSLLSKKGKEFNALSNRFWRKKIWRLKYLGTPKKEVKGGR